MSTHIPMIVLLTAVASALTASEALHASVLDSGGNGREATPATVLVTNQTALLDAARRFRGENAGVLPTVDFAREVVLVVNAGASDATAPPTCAGTFANDVVEEVLISVPSYQVVIQRLPNLPTADLSKLSKYNIYLFVRLPRRIGRPYGVCFDRRELISESPVWTETTRFTLGADGSVSEESPTVGR